MGIDAMLPEEGLPGYTAFQTGFDQGKHFDLVSGITLIIHSSDFYIKAICFIFALQYVHGRRVTHLLFMY